MNNNNTITFQLPEELKEKLIKISKKNYISQSEQLRTFIKNYEI